MYSLQLLVSSGLVITPCTCRPARCRSRGCWRWWENSERPLDSAEWRQCDVTHRVLVPGSQQKTRRMRCGFPLFSVC